MGVFIRAVISGFGFSLGAALFRKASRAVGFEEGAGNSDKGRGDSAGGEAPDGDEGSAEEDDDADHGAREIDLT